MARIDQSRLQDLEALTEYMSKTFNLSPAHVLSNVSYNSNEQLVSFTKAGSVQKASPMGAEGSAAAKHAQNQYTPEQWRNMSGADQQGASSEMGASFRKTPPEEMPEGIKKEAAAPASRRDFAAETLASNGTDDTRGMTEAERRAYIRQQNAKRQEAERAAAKPAARYPDIKAGRLSRNPAIVAGLRAPADPNAFPDVGKPSGGRVPRRPTLDQIDAFSQSLALKSFNMKEFAKSVNALEMISEKMIKDFGGR